MSEYIIDLHPKEIEALNRRIVEILSMPEELLRQYTTKPHITEDEQATLEKAAIAYQSGKFMTAIKYYRKYIRKKGNANTEDYEHSQLDIVVQYLLSKSLMEMKQFTDLVEARDILIELEETVAQKYPMIYCALAELYIKLFCFKDGERMINKGLRILNGGNENLMNCYIPITNKIIVESTSQGLSTELLKLREQCMGWHRPDAVCFMTNCRLNSPHHLADRNIYFNSPAFNGMVVVKCNNIDACNIQFHAMCWKIQKKILSSGQKMSDKDFLNWKCFTPNCGDEGVTSRIQKIEIRGDDKVTKVIELPVEKQERPRNTPSKGATRKQRIKLMNTRTMQARNKSRPPTAKKITFDDVKVFENPPNEIDVLNPELLNFKHLAIDCRPDTQIHGNTGPIINHNEKPHAQDAHDDCDQFAGMKSFLHSYFHQFISYNGPVKIDLVQKIWDEASSLIGNCDTFLYDSNCGNIIEFLLQSSIFSVVDDHICINESLPGNHSSVRGETSTTQIENENSEAIFTDDPKLGNAALPIIDNAAGPAMEIVAANTQNTKLISENPNSSHMNHVEHTFMSNGESLYPTERIECESESVIDSDINNDSLPASPITIYEKSNDMMDSVMKQLETAENELKIKDIELTNMKMTMLRMNLDSQYMTIRGFIQSRLIDCQKEYSIVGKMQNALQKYVGTPLPLNEREWLDPINVLSGMTQTLQVIYDKKLAEINSKEHCKSIDDVHLSMPSLPVLPNRNIPEMLQIALDMCYNRFQPTLPIFRPPYGNYSQHWNDVVPHNMYPQLPSFMPQVPPTTHLILPTNNNSQTSTASMPIPKQLTTINDEVKSSSVDSFDFLKNKEENLECEETIRDEKIGDKISISNSEQGPNATSRAEHKKPSQDLLLDLLRSRNSGVLEYDLLWCVSKVRKSNNNSLTGLPLSVIADAVEEQLYQREKLQLADYSVNIQREIRQDPPCQRLRHTSVSSTSSHVSTASSNRESVTKKNPWNKLVDASSWQDADSEENLCVICIEPLKTRTSNSVYKLQCKHTFHKECIETWLKKERSCPSCRTVAVMDSQFPPLQ